MSEKIADWLIEQKAISTGERELYAYAVHISDCFCFGYRSFFGNADRGSSYDYVIYSS